MAGDVGRMYHFNYLDEIDNPSVAAPTFSGTAIAGYPVDNAFTWFDWQRMTGTDAGDIDIVPGAITDAYAFVGYFGPCLGAGTGITVTVKIETSPGSFTTKATWNVPEEGGLFIYDSGASPMTVSSSRKVRFSIAMGGSTNEWEIRNLALLKKVDMPIGQRVGITPARFKTGAEYSNPMSVNGRFMGRDVVRRAKSYTIELEPITETQVDTVAALFEYLEQHPVYYSRVDPNDSSKYRSGDLMYCVADSVEAPVYVEPVPRMKITIPLRVAGDA